MSPRNAVVLVPFPSTQSPAATATTLTLLKSSVRYGTTTLSPLLLFSLHDSRALCSVYSSFFLISTVFH
ncbi:hypothetical protein Ahy_B10g104219 isoform A [Arachis hypogaea]|uniref:Uncharacterized protein n=1 Tax=Arachis hypogaea TaxID=3818 RepID=A0A444X4Y8_ARAHY|nr:hypothetical protein Ahy_B10g104219 isoform A [Arachis hypogaea]